MRRKISSNTGITDPQVHQHTLININREVFNLFLTISGFLIFAFNVFLMFLFGSGDVNTSLCIGGYLLACSVGASIDYKNSFTGFKTIVVLSIIVFTIIMSYLFIITLKNYFLRVLLY